MTAILTHRLYRFYGIPNSNIIRTKNYNAWLLLIDVVCV